MIGEVLPTEHVWQIALARIFDTRQHVRMHQFSRQSVPAALKFRSHNPHPDIPPSNYSLVI